jgi:hypothetical protein
MTRPITRITPVGPAHAYQTYRIVSPPDVRLLSACEQAGCLAWRYGWETRVDEATELGRNQAAYIRRQSGRTFKEQRSGGLTVFRFESRQRCFGEHHTRPEVYLVRGGDWRQNLGLIRQHQRPADWVEDLGEHQDRLTARLERG